MVVRMVHFVNLFPGLNVTENWFCECQNSGTLHFSAYRAGDACGYLSVCGGFRWRTVIMNGNASVRTDTSPGTCAPRWPIRLSPAGHCYWRKSSRQKYILEATLAGRTVKSMAEVLGVDDQAVFAARTALITKMGWITVWSWWVWPNKRNFCPVSMFMWKLKERKVKVWK